MAHVIKGSMTRQELASKYGISDKAFNERLKKRFKDTFKNVRQFTAGEVAQIVDRIGFWEVTIDE